MNSITFRPTVICPCGSRDYEKTISIETADYPRIWRCTNCFAETPRKTVNRPTNTRRAIEAYLVLREDWRETDAAIDALGTADNRAYCLVHGSTFNYHMKQLSGADKLSTWAVKYHIAEARKALSADKAFVTERTA